jgi:hypothetical protein
MILPPLVFPAPGSTVVKHSTHDSNIDGLNLAHVTEKEREKDIYIHIRERK